MTTRSYCLVSGILFTLVAMAHLARLGLGLPASVGDLAVPMWISAVAVAVPGFLAYQAFRLAKSRNGS